MQVRLPTGSETPGAGRSPTRAGRSVVRSTGRLLRRSFADLSQDGPGWASVTLVDSIRRSLLVAVAGWQVAMVWAISRTTLSTPTELGLLAGAHLCLVLLTLLTAGRRCPPEFLVVLSYLVVLWDYEAAVELNSVLAFAACWLANLLSGLPTFLVRGRSSILIPVVGSAALGAALHLVNPSWGLGLPSAVVVTGLSIMTATRVGVRVLLDFAGRADHTEVAAQEARRAAAVVRAASLELAEDARVLHDTAINTLGAIANGGAGTRDVAAVRERCRRDTVAIAELRSARSARRADRTSLYELFDVAELTVDRTGLDDAELLAVEQARPAEVVTLMTRAAQEALRNVRKHAGVDRAAVDITLVGADLVVTVADHGRGFDGTLPRGRGFDRSILGRADRVGVETTLETSPGNGTVVRLRHRGPTAAAETVAVQNPIDEGLDFTQVVTDLRAKAGWAWSAGLVGVGLVIELGNRPGQVTAAYPMLLLISTVAVIAWRVHRRTGRLTTGVAVLLTFAGCAAFVLSAAAVDFGRVDAVYWQAIAPTGPLAILAMSVHRGWNRLVMVLYVLTVAVVTVVSWSASPTTAAIIPVAGAAGAGITMAFRTFGRTVESIGRRAAADHRTAFLTRLESSVRLAADESSRWWRAAGLHRATSLLRSVAEGQAEPADLAVRDACGAEEEYLRQLVQLDPDLVHLGPYAVAALNEAHARGIALSIRTGQTDVPDDVVARSVGTVLMQVLQRTPRAATVVFTVFPTDGGIRICVVGPRRGVERATSGLAPDDELHRSVSYQQLGDQGMLEGELQLARA